MGLFMELQTKVNIPKSSFKINPTDKLLFVGSCFAENIGRRFVENQFDAVVNPYGTMYNPASVMHTIEKGPLPPPSPVGREPLTPSKALFTEWYTLAGLYIVPYGLTIASN